MDFEKKFERFVMVAKKKYVGQAKDGSRKTSGLELKKRDTLPKAEEWQKWVIDELLNREKINAKYFYRQAKKWKKLVYSGELKKEEILFQKRLSQDIEVYGTKKVIDKKTGRPKLNKEGEVRKVPIPIHARIALDLQKRFNNAKGKEHIWQAGSYVPYIIVGSKKKLEGIWAEDFKEGQYDKDYYWESCYGPSQRVLEAVFESKAWSKLAERTKEYKQQELKI